MKEAERLDSAIIEARTSVDEAIMNPGVDTTPPPEIPAIDEIDPKIFSHSA